MTETRVHPETGKVLRRDTREHVLRLGPLVRIVLVAGWYPDDDSDSLHTGAELRVKEEAMKDLRAEYGRHVRRIRQRLKLTQEKAGAVLGGGPRAFQKYEAGAIIPSEAAVGLLEILDRNPSALQVLLDLNEKRGRAEGATDSLATVSNDKVRRPVVSRRQATSRRQAQSA